MQVLDLVVLEAAERPAQVLDQPGLEVRGFGQLWVRRLQLLHALERNRVVLLAKMELSRAVRLLLGKVRHAPP